MKESTSCKIIFRLVRDRALSILGLEERGVQAACYGFRPAAVEEQRLLRMSSWRSVGAVFQLLLLGGVLQSAACTEGIPIWLCEV